MMNRMRALRSLAAVVILTAASGVASAETLTADRAVQIALRSSTAAINAAAGVMDAKAGLYGAYVGILPRVTASVNRSNSVTTGEHSPARLGGAVSTTETITDRETHGTTPGLAGSWSVLDLSNIEGFSSARNSLKAARHRQASSRNDIAFATRRQFYEVVKAIRLADVAAGALRLARDDQRRVRALFEVGSVSRNDLLKAQVRTAQSELDSLTASQNVTVQRTALATQLGMEESKLGEVDTVLTTQTHEYDEAALVGEAAGHRPDLMAAEAEVRAAQAAKWSARLMRMPYVTVSGTYDFKSKNRLTSTLTSPPPPPPYDVFFPQGARGSTTTTDRFTSVQLALNWDFVDGLAADARNATASAQLARSTAARDELRRNLASDVHQALLAYTAAVVGAEVARSAEESALESVKLTQQKYNVGSATILELIDAQVQLQKSQSDRVSAAAAIRVAEAKLDMVRGKQQ